MYCSYCNKFNSLGGFKRQKFILYQLQMLELWIRAGLWSFWGLSGEFVSSSFLWLLILPASAYLCFSLTFPYSDVSHSSPSVSLVGLPVMRQHTQTTQDKLPFSRSLSYSKPLPQKTNITFAIKNDIHNLGIKIWIYIGVGRLHSSHYT